jgi:NADH-quinone oxidoreductase subunit K
MLSLQAYLTLSAIIFSIGITGIIINRKNIIIVMMCTELLLISVNFNFIAFSHFLEDLAGQVFVFFILTVAAAEAAIGLAILVALYRNKKTISVSALDKLRN